MELYLDYILKEIVKIGFLPCTDAILIICIVVFFDTVPRK